MKSAVRFLFFPLLVLMVACASPSPGNQVDDAIRCCNDHDFARSREIVDRLMADSAALDTMSVDHLCRLASLCLQLDSVGDSAPDNSGEALAARCLGVARHIDSDSVELYLHSIPREQAMRLSVIDRVASYLAIPRDSLVVEGDTVQ